MIVVLELWF
uniref:Uncharacterized protein n=1 Tax=Arundo donax TaxID=35708 RepID=A0A0A9BGG9_ARUDO